jgi:homoserine kinase
VTVTVPATSANLGPGFDALGLALSLHDEVRVRIEDDSTPELSLHVNGEGADAVPRDASHLVVRALLTTYDSVGVARPHLTMWCTNRIPHGRGLGSSAAAAVAGVLAAKVLSGAALDDDAALGLATAIEGHPDNAAAALLGGLTVAWTDGASARAVRLDPAPSVRAVVFVPDAELSTEKARGLLPATVPHADAAHSAGRAALLVAALTSRPDLLLAATEDRLHQEYREPAMPVSLELVARLRAAGVAAVVSGAGPSVLALTTTGSAGLDPALTPPGFRVMDVDVAARGAQVRIPAAD